ncbi:MAG: twin-arginine translocase TatA/TatE family subunit [Phascolarctobacterium sp.]|nr:twin-arginine translocase TatA/TatE family subunit [Phascolarctobacterium sp.]
MRLGATELLLILAVAIIVFGAGKIGGLGKALGTSIREFKEEVKSKDDEGGEKANGKSSAKK